MTYIQYENANLRGESMRLIDIANQIIAEYAKDKFTLTLRQLYYQFVSRDIIPNSEKSYNNLGTLITKGRMQGLISWTAIEDRGRGIKPWLIEEDQQEVLNGIEYNFALDFWKRQETYVEVWIEKDALSSVIERPCRTWRVPYMPCKGYLSASEAWRAGQRFKEAQEAGFKCVMIHLGDHDPSGIDMTRDNLERLEMFSEGSVDVRRIALNMDQVRRYNPPSNPAKMTDTRAGDYVRQFGNTSWELDALNPRVISNLITNEIKTLVNQEIWDDTENEQDNARSELAKLHENWDQVKEFLKEIE